MTIPEIVFIAAAIVTGLVQWIKEIPKIPSWLYPLFAIIFGIVIIPLLAAIAEGHVVFSGATTVYGIIAGLSAVGLYNVGSSTGGGVVGLFKPKTVSPIGENGSIN